VFIRFTAVLLFCVLFLTRVFPSAQRLLQKNSGFRFLLDLLHACLCLFTFVFNALRRCSKGFVSKRNKHHMLRMLAACSCRQGATPAELASELGRAAAGWKNDEV